MHYQKIILLLPFLGLLLFTGSNRGDVCDAGSKIRGNTSAFDQATPRFAVPAVEAYRASIAAPEASQVVAQSPTGRRSFSVNPQSRGPGIGPQVIAPSYRERSLNRGQSNLRALHDAGAKIRGEL